MAASSFLKVMMKPKDTDFLHKGKFSCNSCGACCSFIKPLAESGKINSAWVLPSGGCIHLKKNPNDQNKYVCDIYDSRPDICRIDKTLKATNTDLQIARMCKVMKEYKDFRDGKPTGWWK